MGGETTRGGVSERRGTGTADGWSSRRPRKEGGNLNFLFVFSFWLLAGSVREGAGRGAVVQQCGKGDGGIRGSGEYGQMVPGTGRCSQPRG